MGAVNEVRKNSAVWENLRVFTAGLRTLAVSESLALGSNGFCVSTGTSYENWVYFPERVTSSEVVNDVVRFFGERDETFMWPVYDGGIEILEGAGLEYAGDLTAMCLDSAEVSVLENGSVTFEAVTRENAGVWAEIMRLGFGGEGDAPEEYCRFVRALTDDVEKFSLYLAKYAGEYAGTFLVTHEPERTGVYYFAVVPSFRRKGIARAMMSEICRLSDGKRIVLQATPMGVKFYRAFGFEDMFRIPVYSTDSDIL